MLRLNQFIHALALTLSFFSVTTATPLIPPNHNSLTASNRMVTCTASTRWVPSHVIPFSQDCHEALDQMRRVEGNKRSDQRFEFLAPDRQQRTRLLPLRTPRVYSAKSCTVAVTMLSSYKPWDLPPETRRGPYPNSEIATLEELMQGARAVVASCVDGKGQAGWSGEGWSNLGIAVAVFESGSQIDRLVKAQDPRRVGGFGMDGTAVLEA